MKNKKEQIQEPKIIGFLIEGENIIVSNPCTIPIDMMKDALKKKREKGKVTFIGGIMIKLPKGVKIK